MVSSLLYNNLIKKIDNNYYEICERTEMEKKLYIEMQKIISLNTLKLNKKSENLFFSHTNEYLNIFKFDVTISDVNGCEPNKTIAPLFFIILLYLYAH